MNYYGQYLFLSSEPSFQQVFQLNIQHVERIWTWEEIINSNLKEVK